MGTVQESGTWSGSSYAYTGMGEIIASLSASPGPTRGQVSWVRIRVDGKTVAEARNDEDAAAVGLPGRRSLAVEAVISDPPG